MMDMFVIRSKRKPNEPSSSTNKLNSIEKESEKRVRVDVEISNDLIGDPGKRIPIDSYPVNMRDSMRRRYLAKGPSQPSRHDFPKSKFGKENRGFQYIWFKKYPWLEYSVSKDAAFCLHCYLFRSGNKFGDKAFTQSGFKNWKNALESFILHEGGTTSSHHYAKNKVDQYKNQRENVDHVLASKCSVLEAQYRIRLTAVLHVIRFLLEAGVAFRGHDESNESTRPGNFLLLIQWWCKRDAGVRKVMQNAPGNCQLRSPTIQLQIIEACAAETTKVILNEINDKFFSLLIDEARDCSIKEQMAVVLRFVNDFGEIIERFLGIVHVSDTSAQSLKTAIDGFLAMHRLSLSKVRGQGYDGASNMRGELNGLKTLILNENKHAHYIHCYAHQLQLVVVATARGVTTVSFFFDYLPMIVTTVGASCKRKESLKQLHHEKLVEKIEKAEISTGRGKNQEINLTRPGDTRWGSHYKTIVRLFEMWDSVVEVLLVVKKYGTDSKARGVADGLLVKMLDFEFVLIGKLMARLLGMTNGLSQMLQTKNQNIVSAMNAIKLVKSGLQAYRDDGWEELLIEVTKFCEARKIHVPKMEEIISCRARRLMDGDMTNFHRFRMDIFHEVIALLCIEMDDRFTESTSELLLCISCLDPSNLFASFDRVRLLHLANLYSEDFSHCEIAELDHQLSLYINDMRSNEAFSSLRSLSELAKKMVENEHHIQFRLVYRLVELALVLPVATATVERCFSAMNIVKTDLRNRMGDDYLSDCLLCYTENNAFNSVEDESILQNFQHSRSRRIDLPSISSSKVVFK